MKVITIGVSSRYVASRTFSLQLQHIKDYELGLIDKIILVNKETNEVIIELTGKALKRAIKSARIRITGNDFWCLAEY